MLADDKADCGEVAGLTSAAGTGASGREGSG